MLLSPPLPSPSPPPTPPVGTGLLCGWNPALSPPELAALCHLLVEISTVYLVCSSLCRLANQSINLSAEISLICLERRDGLQNYSFGFHSLCLIFDRWLAFAFNITRNSFPKNEFFSFPPPPPHRLMKAVQIGDRAGSRIRFVSSFPQ